MALAAPWCQPMRGARSMCGESVMCWILTKQDVLLNVNTTRILKCIRKDSRMLFMIIRSLGGTEGTTGCSGMFE